MTIDTRKQRGRRDRSVNFPVAPSRADTPADYAPLLAELKQRISQERLRALLANNSAMVLLYWDIGQRVLEKQHLQGWGARIIDRLSADLRDAFPGMSGFSSRNLKYMRAFCAAWPERAIVQRTVAQLPWRHNIALLEKLDAPDERLWCDDLYLDLLFYHLKLRCYVVVELKARKFEPGDGAQLGIYMTAVNRLLTHPDDKPSVGLLLVREKNRVLVEYALSNSTQPISVAEWQTHLTRTLPTELQTCLPSIEEIEAELAESQAPTIDRTQSK